MRSSKGIGIEGQGLKDLECLVLGHDVCCIWGFPKLEVPCWGFPV